MDKQKILEIFELLEKCPKTRAALPCDLEKFKKMALVMDDEVLDKLHATLILESQLNG